MPELIADETSFDVMPFEPSDERPARLNRELLRWQLQRDRFQTKRAMATKKALIFGSCPLKVSMAVETQVMKVRRFLTPDQMVAIMQDPNLDEVGKREALDPFEMRRVSIKKDPTLIVCNLFDTWVDPASARWDLEDARWVHHRSWPSAEELLAKERAGLYKGVSKYLADRSKDKDQAKGTGGDSTERLENEDGDMADERRGDRFEVVEEWRRGPNGIELTVILDRKVCLRKGPSPFNHGKLPFVLAVTQPDVESAYGISEVWTIEQLQEAIWTLQNAQFNALRLTIEPPVLLDERDPKLKDFRWKPRARYYSQNPEKAIKSVEIGQASAFTSAQEIQNLIGMMERVTGINSSIAGLSSEDTATQATMNLSQGKSRIGLKLLHLDEAFARCAEMMIQLNQQFLDQARVIRIAGKRGEEWQTVGPEDIAGMFDVRPKSATERTMMDKQREQSVQLLTVFQPLAQAGLVDIEYFVRKVAEDHNLEPDKIGVRSMQEVMQAQLAAQFNNAAAMQGLQPPPPPPAPPAPDNSTNITVQQGEQAA